MQIARDIADRAPSVPCMKTLLGLATSLTLVLGACGGGSTGKLEKLKDEACACKDKACGDEVNKKLDAAMEDLEKEYGGKEPDEKDAAKIMGIMLEAGQCLQKLK